MKLATETTENTEIGLAALCVLGGLCGGFFLV